MKKSIYTPNYSFQASIKKILNFQYYPTAYCRHNLKRPKLAFFLENYSYSIATDFKVNQPNVVGRVFNYTSFFCATRSLKFTETSLIFSSKIAYAFYLSNLFLTFLGNNKYKSYMILYPLKGNFAVYTSFYISYITQAALSESFFNKFLMRGKDYKRFNKKFCYSYFYLVKHKYFQNPFYLYSMRFSYTFKEPQISFKTQSSIDVFIQAELLRIAAEQALLVVATPEVEDEVEPGPELDPDSDLHEENVWIMICELLAELEAAEKIATPEVWAPLLTLVDLTIADEPELDITLPIKYYQYFLPHMYEKPEDLIYDDDDPSLLKSPTKNVVCKN
jgi:hypothetical protein